MQRKRSLNPENPASETTEKKSRKKRITKTPTLSDLKILETTIADKDIVSSCYLEKEDGKYKRVLYASANPTYLNERSLYARAADGESLSFFHKFRSAFQGSSYHSCFQEFRGKYTFKMPLRSEYMGHERFLFSIECTPEADERTLQEIAAAANRWIDRYLSKAYKKIERAKDKENNKSFYPVGNTVNSPDYPISQSQRFADSQYHVPQEPFYSMGFEHQHSLIDNNSLLGIPPYVAMQPYFASPYTQQHPPMPSYGVNSYPYESIGYPPTMTPTNLTFSSPYYVEPLTQQITQVPDYVTFSAPYYLDPLSQQITQGPVDSTFNSPYYLDPQQREDMSQISHSNQARVLPENANPFVSNEAYQVVELIPPVQQTNVVQKDSSKTIATSAHSLFDTNLHVNKESTVDYDDFPNKTLFTADNFDFSELSKFG